MSRITFFNIPAYGHTNPTLEVVRELVKRGHEVHYYSFREFRDRIENTGAACICCDEYMPPAPADIDKKVGRDLASLISMTVHVTLAMEEGILKEFENGSPTASCPIPSASGESSMPKGWESLMCVRQPPLRSTGTPQS